MTFGLAARLKAPQYAFYPARVLRRALEGHVGRERPERVVDALLPWGLPITIRPGEAIGHSIAATGIFDPCVSETLYRLIDPGDRAIDVGANVGYMTSIMVTRAGARGGVVAIEPNPELHPLLERNVARWGARPGASPIETHAVALSDHDGTAVLRIPALFARNQGRASIERREGEGGADPWHAVTTVATRRLDALVGDRAVDVVKIDVEGHEAGVLRGAARLLDARRIRDVVFEHDGYPTPATALLETAGYTVLALDASLFGPAVGPAAKRRPWQGWEGSSYLATVAPERAMRRLGLRGWFLPGIRWGSAARP